MADVYKGLTIKLGVDDTSLSKALRSARSESIGVTSELKKIQKALKLDPGNTKLLSQQQQDYRKKIASTKKELDYLKQAESEIGKEDMGSDQWVKLQSDIVIAEQKLRGYKQALAETIIEQNVANSTLGKVGGAVERFGGKVEGIGRGMQSVGGALTRTVTPAIIAAGTATVIAATDIDTGLTNVKKTVDGTAEQYGELKQAAVDFSQTNAVSARQILDIQALGAQLGFSIDELDEFSRVVSGLDIATNMDAETAGTELARFANITKMSHGEIGNYGSAIVGLGNSFATTEGEISAMAMRIAASGEQVGMSQADILGVATALSSLGVEAEAGGTAVSTIMANIDKAIATNADSVATWASAAQMSTDDFAAAWKNKPVDALAAVLSGMESTTAEGGNMSVMLEELGIDSIRQTDVMKRLAGNSELVGNAVSKSNEEWSKNTALQKEVDNRNESLAAKFEILKNRVVAIADNVGGPLADALLDALEAAEPLFSAIADGAKVFADMDDDQQQLIITLVGVAAAMGPVMSLVGGGIAKIKTFGVGIQNAARFMAKFDAVTAGSSRTIFSYESSTKKASKSTATMTGSVKGASVALGALKTTLAAVGIAAAIQLVVSLVGEFQQAQDRAETLSKATDGLKGSFDKAKSSYTETANELKNASSAAGEYAKSVDDVIKSQADLAQKASDTWSELGANSALLDGYIGTIEALADKSNLTQEEQGKLASAVKGFNDICDTSVSVIDPLNGKLSEQKDAIKAVADAYYEQARAAAAQDLLTDAIKQQMENTHALADAKNKLAEAEEGWGIWAGDFAVLADEQSVKYKEMKDEVQRLEEASSSCNETVDYYNGLIGESSRAMTSTEETLHGLISSYDGLSEKLSEAGVDTSAFITALSDLGVSTSDLSSLTSDELASVASSYDGTWQSVISKLDEFGIDVSAKTLEATQGATQSINTEAPNIQAAADAAGSSAGQGYADALANKREAAVSAALQVTGMTLEQFNASATQAGVEGDEAVTAYANSISAGQGKSQLSASLNASSATGGFGTGDGATPGSQLGNRFANAVASARGTARSQGSNVAEAAGGGMQSNSWSASSWGSHLVQNFASGISGMVSYAASAASSVANAVKNILGHTIPKAGPLRNGGKGEKEWGKHTVQNYISGVRSQIPELKKAMNEVSAATAMSMASPERMRIATTIPESARKSSSPSVNVSVQSPDGITKADVYDAMVAAMSKSSGGKEVTLYVDGRQLSGAIAGHIDTEFGIMQERSIR